MVRDIDKLAVGRVTYCCWCDDEGKLVDDGTVSRLGKTAFRMTSALPMRELSHIFNRLRSDRLIFIADACYSGATGGRTISITGGMRARISDKFLDRISSGKGRIILTASGANEVSEENHELKHGVFTHFLVQGLGGAADANRDGLITVDEIYNYVSTEVPRETGQEQHPVKKGAVEGWLVMGVVN